MNEELTGLGAVEALQKLNQFKDYAVSHPYLIKIDQSLMRAIVEPAGFAHVLVYGPSGVGKTTMINRLQKRLNDSKNSYSTSTDFQGNPSCSPTMPLLLLETRPSDGGAFNRADYYRTALKKLGEPFYERRLFVDINTEQTWEKKGRARSSKNAQFNDSPELRQALEDALIKRGVRAVILDEAQHLMKVGNGQGAGKLLDQLDWIKSITNVTGVLHILIGTYELLNFQNLSGQTARRGLDLHFPRYQFSLELDRQDFQGVLLALLKQVPLHTDVSALMQQWFYFYERSIGCVGVLKEWLVRTCAATFHEGEDTLTWERLQENALPLAACERMAIDAVEGEQKLAYSASRQEHLSRLLKMDTASTGKTYSLNEHNSILEQESSLSNVSTTKKARKSSTSSKDKKCSQSSSTQTPVSLELELEPTKTVAKKSRKKKISSSYEENSATISLNDLSDPNLLSNNNSSISPLPTSPPAKKSSRRAGQRKPQRDKVD